MDTVDVNAASAAQLSVLLDLFDDDDVARVIAARPFADAAALQRVLPDRVARTHPGLSLPKLNINAATRGDLIRLGVPADTAQAILNRRPYYFLSQLRAIDGVGPVFESITAVYMAPQVSYVDKVTGRTVNLSPDPSRVVVPPSQTEGISAKLDLRRLGLKPLFGGSRGASQVFAIPETESNDDVWAQLKREPSQEALPGFKDERSGPRFLDPQYCVVQFVDGVTEARQQEIIAGLGLQVASDHRASGLYTLRIPDAKSDPNALGRVLAVLNVQPEVKFAEPNYIGFDDIDGFEGLRPRPLPDPPQTESLRDDALPWNLALVNAREAWANGTGCANVILAIVDSGVDTSHPALAGGILPRGNEDWNFADENGPEPMDDQGHGTFIAGILVGNGIKIIRGICPGCRVLPLKVALTGESNAYATRRSAILYALDYVRPGQRLVINLSWKTTGDVALIRDAVNTAISRGAIVVASAGNDAEQARANVPHFPSDYPGVIAVAAVGPDRKRAFYSYYGDEIDISAPGGTDPDKTELAITSTVPGGGIGADAGTSFAAPHVVGAIALLFSQNLSATPAQVRFALDSTAQPLTEPGLGRGLMDAAAALNLKAPTQPSSDTPPVVISGGTTPVGTNGAGTVSSLDLLNSAEADDLISRFNLVPFTARLLVARRPYASVDQIRGTLGLTDEQFTRIAN